MKLVFPGGEHPQVLLGQGVNKIGSSTAATIVLNRPGVLPEHCQLHVSAHGVMLDVPRGTTMAVNGRQVAGLIALRSGDEVAFDGIQARLLAMESVIAVVHQAGAPDAQRPSDNDDPGVTAVRQVLPRFVLRGVSAEVRDRNLGLHGVITVGRAQDCSLHVDDPGLSRHHARLLPVGDGVLVEDLGSSNGTFINGKRVLRGEAKAGDEIGFDTVRFRLTASGQPEPMASEKTELLQPPRRLRLHWPLMALLLIAIAIAVATAIATAS